MTAQPMRLSIERERQLVRQVQQGDRGAMGELLGAYHKRVYHHCLRMLGHPEDAADITQEAMARAIEHVGRFTGKSRFSTWLFRIVVNLSISHLRKRKVRRATSLDNPISGLDDGGAVPLSQLMADSTEPNPADRVQTSEQVDRMIRTLDGLDENLKSVILLRDLQEMDYREIAEVLDLPVGTVKSRLFRGRLALRRQLSRGENDQRHHGDDEVAAP